MARAAQGLVTRRPDAVAWHPQGGSSTAHRAAGFRRIAAVAKQRRVSAPLATPVAGVALEPAIQLELHEAPNLV
jgi:hypothetical protein